jgi:hypothetical protein
MAPPDRPPLPVAAPPACPGGLVCFAGPVLAGTVLDGTVLDGTVLAGTLLAWLPAAPAAPAARNATTRLADGASSRPAPTLGVGK